MPEPRFCPHCETVMSFHYGEDDCEGAALRADVLRGWDRLVHRASGGVSDA